MSRRIFFSTGEPSAERLAVLLAYEMRRHEPELVFEGLGDYRMEQAGFSLWERTTGWATLGPLAAIPQIPGLFRVLQRTVRRLLLDPPDLLVLIDYGAFNLRLAKALRQRGYKAPIVYAFPPSAWRDRPEIAKQVAEVAFPLLPFERQASLYAALGLPYEAPGYPLVSEIRQRTPRQVPQDVGGRVALLPGSRQQELIWNLPTMLEAMVLLRERRPWLEVVLIAADKRFIPYLEKKTKAYPWVHLLENSDGPLRDVDAALIKSGTAVLEAALLGVPTTSMYILSPALAWIVQHIFQFRRGFVTLPNLILDRAIVSERLQAAATPQALADDVDILLTNPRAQEADFEELRACLGGADTLDRWAQCLLAKL